MNTRPSVSVVITCYNYGRFLADAVASVQAQTYPASEIVVIDDGSTDSTAEVARALPVRYVHQANAGVSRARNHGATVTGGELLMFLDADDMLRPTYLERCVQALTHGRPARAAIVRFGNVLGSTGSVTPIFERQIARGGPVTVTHPDMVRYFMTVQEAAALVLQAAALPAAAEAPEAAQIFVLDMGEPVRIDHLARQLIGLHGLRPDTDIKIVYSGVRPGEKLYEDVFYEDEAVRPTAADGVLAAFDPAPDWEALGPAVRDLLAAAAAQDEALMFSRLQALEPAFQRG